MSTASPAGTVRPAPSPTVQHLPPLAGTLRTVVVTAPLVAAAAALVVVGAASLVAPALTGVVAPVVLVAAVAVGLPHGAVDLVQPDVVDGAGPGRRAALGGAYLVGAATAWCAWLVHPVAAVAALLVLSVVHFGTADDVVTRWRTGDGGATGRRGALRVVRVVALGGPPVLLPFAAHERAVAALVAQVAPGGLAALHAGALLALVPVGAAALVSAAVAARRGDLVGAVEPVLLAAVFTVVTPLLAFAVYFGLWHSLRHVGRTVGADLAARAGASGPDLGARAVGGALARFARTAALPTGIAVVAGVLLLAVTGTGAAAAALVLVLCLTVPHAAVVAWQDHRLVVDAAPRGALRSEPGGP